MLNVTRQTQDQVRCWYIDSVRGCLQKLSHLGFAARAVDGHGDRRNKQTRPEENFIISFNNNKLTQIFECLTASSSWSSWQGLHQLHGEHGLLCYARHLPDWWPIQCPFPRDRWHLAKTITIETVVKATRLFAIRFFSLWSKTVDVLDDRRGWGLLKVKWSTMTKRGTTHEVLDISQLGMLRQIFDLRLAEDNVGVWSRALVNIRFVDDKKNRLALANGDTRNSMHGL